MSSLKIALCQINTTVGDLDGNTKLIQQAIENATRQGAHIIILPELAITGYPPEDLLYNRSFITANLNSLEVLRKVPTAAVVIVGYVDSVGDSLYNAAAVLSGGEKLATYGKCFLPNYGVFDENRYFARGDRQLLLNIGGIKCGISICEDLWHKPGPCEEQARLGAKVLLNISASPYEVGKHESRQNIIKNTATRNGVFVAYVNQVGGQDELIFDGGSMVVNPAGLEIAACNRFEEDLRCVEIAELGEVVSSDTTFETRQVVYGADYSSVTHSQASGTTDAKTGEIYAALVLGTRDFLRKCGFDRAGVAVSGGIDSALVACIAADAIGASNVTAVSMPARYSSHGSVSDARQLCCNLGMELVELPINEVHSVIESALGRTIAADIAGVTDENVQARIRGLLIMALSNQRDFMVLATGNKSEMAMGYTTLYGDTVGGLAVLKDVLKTTVYNLARWLNRARSGQIIPSAILEKPPSAELRANQRDQDSLPPYDELDKVIHAYVNERHSLDTIMTKCNLKRDEVARIMDAVDRQEYKRRMSAPGLKITNLSFGRDRRLPIAMSHVPQR